MTYSGKPIDASSQVSRALDNKTLPARAQGQKPQGKFKAVSGQSVGVPAAAKVLTAARPRGTGANIPVPPGVRAQHAAQIAGILFCQPLRGADRPVRSRPPESIHFSPESGRKLVQSSPALDTLKFMLEPPALNSRAGPPALQAFQPRHGGHGETREQRVIRAAAQSFANNRPLASLDRIAGNDNVYRHFSQMMLQLSGRPPIEQHRNAPAFNRDGSLTPEGAMTKTWVGSLSGGTIRNGESPQVWRNCLRPADPSDNRNFLVTVVLDQNMQPLYQFISTSGAPRGGEIDSRNSQINFSMRGAGSSRNPAQLSARILSGSSQGQSRLQHAMRDVGPAYANGFTFIGYDDLVVQSPPDGVKREIRVLPRTLPYSNSQAIEVRDRARDTEYLTMSALSLIFEGGHFPPDARP